MLRPVPVILGSHVSALGLIRSFADKGLRSVCVDCRRGIASFSKYAIFYKSPDPVLAPEKTVTFLQRLGRRLTTKGMFFVAGNDRWLILISRNRPSLEGGFIYPMSEWSVIETATNKAMMYEAAERAGVPIPKTYRLNSAAELDKLADIPLPAILKPAITVDFQERLRTPGRAILIEDICSLKYWTSAIMQAGLESSPLILQEKVDGKVEDLYTITAYSNADAEICGYSIGHKIRQTPPEAGTIKAGKTGHQSRVYDLASKLIKALGFQGICNIEFIRDRRDGDFKLIEINPRPGMWHGSHLAAGINLPYLAYQDTIGAATAQEGTQQGIEGITWVYLTSDLFYSLIGYSLRGYPEHRLTFAEWLASLQGRRVLAVESMSDPLPMVVDWARLLLLPAEVAFKRLRYMLVSRREPHTAKGRKRDQDAA